MILVFLNKDLPPLLLMINQHALINFNNNKPLKNRFNLMNIKMINTILVGMTHKLTTRSSMMKI